MSAAGVITDQTGGVSPPGSRWAPGSRRWRPPLPRLPRPIIRLRRPINTITTATKRGYDRQIRCADQLGEPASRSATSLDDRGGFERYGGVRTQEDAKDRSL